MPDQNAGDVATVDAAMRFIMRGNCMDCFHEECCARADLARALYDLEKRCPQ